MGGRAPEIRIQLEGERDCPDVIVDDVPGSMATVTVSVALDEGWIDDQRRRLDEVDGGPARWWNPPSVSTSGVRTESDVHSRDAPPHPQPAYRAPCRCAYGRSRIVRGECPGNSLEDRVCACLLAWRFSDLAVLRRVTVIPCCCTLVALASGTRRALLTWLTARSGTDLAPWLGLWERGEMASLGPTATPLRWRPVHPRDWLRLDPQAGGPGVGDLADPGGEAGVPDGGAVPAWCRQHYPLPVH